MTSLIEREAEVAAFRKALTSKSSFSLLFGQRRTGKTFLLQHLLAAQPNTLFFIADASTSTSLVERFALAAASALPSFVPVDPRSAAAGGWSSALTLLVQGAAAARRSLVLVLDEFQYLLAAEPAIASVLQRLWDEFHTRMSLHLVLCGSALGVLARLGDAGAPLHGRFGLRMKLRPFNYLQAHRFAPSWTPVDAFRAFGMFGGLARHLASIDPSASASENAVANLLNPFGPLHDAATDLVRCEHVSSRAEAGAVLASVASGENAFNSIAARSGLTAARADAVLKELCVLELIRRETRFGDKPGSRFSRYVCADPLVAFTHRFVVPNRMALLGTPASRIWSRRIEPRLDDYMGWVFEQVARQAVADGVLGDLTGPVDELSPYWSRDGSTQIDLCVRSGKTVLLLECKWSSRTPLGLSALRQLRDHAARLPALPGTSVRLGLVSAGGFARELVQLERLGEVILIGPQHLLPRKRRAR